jgi:hypothetical protein
MKKGEVYAGSYPTAVRLIFSKKKLEKVKLV